MPKGIAARVCFYWKIQRGKILVDQLPLQQKKSSQNFFKTRKNPID